MGKKISDEFGKIWNARKFNCNDKYFLQMNYQTKTTNTIQIIVTRPWNGKEWLATSPMYVSPI